MELLDAALAFALTMGALSTIATIAVEFGHRFFRIRKRNLVNTVGHLLDHLSWLPQEEQWQFAVGVLRNPTRAVKQDDKQTKLLKFLFDIGGSIDDAKLTGDVRAALGGFRWWLWSRSIYDSVSVEHVLRRFAELPSAKKMIGDDRQKAEAELQRIARRYQEVRSAVSADFKRRSQLWSVLAAVIFAFAVNVDALRLFEAYKNDPQLAGKIIANEEELKARTAMLDDNLAKYEAAVATREAAAAAAQAGEDQPRLDEATQSVDELSKELQDNLTIADLEDLGVPIGWDYWPYGELDGPQPPALWFVQVLLTGLLMGLGAPFWFDFAKRIGEVRKAFGGTGSSEERLSGKNVGAESNDRSALASEIVDDTLADSEGPEAAVDNEGPVAPVG